MTTEWLGTGSKAKDVASTHQDNENLSFELEFPDVDENVDLLLTAHKFIDTMSSKGKN